MKPIITTKLENNVLILKTSGEIDSWEQITDDIYKEVLKHNTKKIILDHRDLQFPTSILRYVEVVEHYEKNFPMEIHQLKVAVVVKEEYKNVARFWETYCLNRGFRYLAFTSMRDATDWVMI